jgi:predicted amidophosphoribosyltransferase
MISPITGKETAWDECPYCGADMGTHGLPQFCPDCGTEQTYEGMPPEPPARKKEGGEQ